MNVTNPKGIPFNVPVSITYNPGYLGKIELIAIISGYGFNAIKSYLGEGYSFKILATDTSFYIFGEAERLNVDGIENFEVLKWTDLPLYLGWKFTTPLLANCIKKFDYDNKRATAIDRPDLGRD